MKVLLSVCINVCVCLRSGFIPDSCPEPIHFVCKEFFTVTQGGGRGVVVMTAEGERFAHHSGM